jgi:hypothetical protein
MAKAGIVETGAPVAKKPAFTETLTVPAVPDVVTDEQYVLLGEARNRARAYMRKVEEFYTPRKQRAHGLWQAEIADEKAAKAPAVAFLAAADPKLLAYDDAKEAERRAEQARLEELARQQEEARKLEEAAALELEAHRTGDADLAQQAAEILEEPTETPTVFVASRTPVVGGLGARATYAAEVTDLKKLIAYVAKHPEHTNLLQANQTALNQLARALRDNMQIDGVRAVKNRSLASRG